MRRSYASGYARESRREPSLLWFVVGAIVIGVGYIYISGLGKSGNGIEGGSGSAELSGSGGDGTVVAGNSGNGGGNPGEETVRPAVPVVDNGEGGPQVGNVWRAGTQIVMAWIPEGDYLVRTDAGVVTNTFERGFWLAVRPVTESEYEEVMGTNPVPEGKRDPRAPVTRVSWKEANQFAAQLTLKEKKDGKLPANYEYRIPTEMAWEFAAGGGEDGSSLRIRDEDSRDLTWWRINGIKEFQDSQHEGALRAGSLDVGVVSEWTADEVKGGLQTKLVRGAPHTAFLGREDEVVKARYTIYHEDEKLPFLGFRVVMVKTGPDRSIADAAGGSRGGSRLIPVAIRALEPGEEIDYVKRREAFNLEELFEPSRLSRDSALTKYNVLRKVQMELKENGYYRAKVDGYPGKSTQKAIDQFQAVVGLPKTGRLDDVTLLSLGVIDDDSEGGGNLPTTAQADVRSRPLPMPVASAIPVENGRDNPAAVSAYPSAERPPGEVVGARPTNDSPPPRAVPAYPGGISNLPRAIPARPTGTVAPDSGYEESPELRYDGVRGKLKMFGDVLSGTYDVREDRRRR